MSIAKAPNSTPGLSFIGLLLCGGRLINWNSNQSLGQWHGFIVFAIFRFSNFRYKIVNHLEVRVLVVAHRDLPLAMCIALRMVCQFPITAATASVPLLNVANLSSNCCICPARPAERSRSCFRDSSSSFFSLMRACSTEDWLLGLERLEEDRIWEGKAVARGPWDMMSCNFTRRIISLYRYHGINRPDRRSHVRASETRPVNAEISREESGGWLPGRPNVGKQTQGPTPL